MFTVFGVEYETLTAFSACIDSGVEIVRLRLSVQVVPEPETIKVGSVTLAPLKII